MDNDLCPRCAAELLDINVAPDSRVSTQRISNEPIDWRWFDNSFTGSCESIPQGPPAGDMGHNILT
jgi:hypothetical protein